MPGTEDHLRATSDAILSDLKALTALEEEKRPIEPSDPALVPASKEIHRLARRLVRETAEEQDLAADLHDELHAGDDPAR
jgi:hypothetical protein